MYMNKTEHYQHLGLLLPVIQHEQRSNNLYELLLSASGQNIITDISKMYMNVHCTFMYVYCMDMS
jgi:hypothetical protein